MNNNNNKRNTRKHFFSLILINIIAAVIVILLVITFLVKASSKDSKDKNKQINKENNSKNNELSEQNLTSLQDIENCPYLKEDKLPVPWSQEEKNYAAELKKITPNFVVRCWKKGYHWHDILQLWEWKISELDIPDLNAKQRIGVVWSLSTHPDLSPEKLDKSLEKPADEFEMPKKGESINLAVIIRKISSGEPKINIDKKIQESPLDFDNYDKNTTRDYIQKLVNLVLTMEKDVNSQQYEISLLCSLGTESFQKEEKIGWGRTSGSSSGSAICLALYSALHKIPISSKVCATGTIRTRSEESKVKNIDGQEVILKKGDNVPIGGLKEKTAAAVEKGLNQLVLSKYHSAPNILTKPSDKDPTKNITSPDYQQVVPAEIKRKMKVYWTKNISELRELMLGGKLS